MIADPETLMHRYVSEDNGDLTPDEMEILLFALYMESDRNKGLAWEARHALVRARMAQNLWRTCPCC